MNVKSWDIKLLKEKLKYYQKLLSRTKDLKEKERLYKTVKSYQSFIDDYYRIYKRPKYSYISRTDREFFEQTSQVIPILIGANTYILNNRLLFQAKPSSIKISKDTILTTTRDFYHHIKGIFLEKYEEYYQNESIYINFLKPTSNQIGGNIVRPEGANEAFININVFNGLYDIATSIHEHGHAIGASINEKHTKNALINEIESIFFELLYLDNIDNQEYNYEEIRNAKESSISMYHGCLNEIDTKYMTTLKGITDQKESIKIIKTKYDIETEYLDSIIFTPLKELVNYALSYLIAVELFLLYKKNNYAALSILEKLIRINSNNEDKVLSMLNSVGIIPGKNLAKFYKQYLNIKGTSKTLH